MTKDIRSWCKSDRFESVHVDLVVLDYSEGYRYLCTFIDRTTDWVEAILLNDEQGIFLITGCHGMTYI